MKIVCAYSFRLSSSISRNFLSLSRAGVLGARFVGVFGSLGAASVEDEGFAGVSLGFAVDFALLLAGPGFSLDGATRKGVLAFGGSKLCRG